NPRQSAEQASALEHLDHRIDAWRSDAEMRADLLKGWRVAVLDREALDEGKELSLAGSELSGHRRSFLPPIARPIVSWDGGKPGPLSHSARRPPPRSASPLTNHAT